MAKSQFILSLILPWYFKTNRLHPQVEDEAQQKIYNDPPKWSSSTRIGRALLHLALLPWLSATVLFPVENPLSDHPMLPGARIIPLQVTGCGILSCIVA